MTAEKSRGLSRPSRHASARNGAIAVLLLVACLTTRHGLAAEPGGPAPMPPVWGSATARGGAVGCIRREALADARAAARAGDEPKLFDLECVQLKAGTRLTPLDTPWRTGEFEVWQVRASVSESQQPVLFLREYDVLGWDYMGAYPSDLDAYGQLAYLQFKFKQAAPLGVTLAEANPAAPGTVGLYLGPAPLYELYFLCLDIHHLRRSDECRPTFSVTPRAGTAP